MRQPSLLATASSLYADALKYNRLMCEIVATRDIPKDTLGSSAVAAGAFKPVTVGARQRPLYAISDVNNLNGKIATTDVPAGTPITATQWVDAGTVRARGIALPSPGLAPHAGSGPLLC